MESDEEKWRGPVIRLQAHRVLGWINIRNKVKKKYSSSRPGPTGGLKAEKDKKKYSLAKSFIFSKDKRFCM
jgi:hypothetical protein